MERFLHLFLFVHFYEWRDSHEVYEYDYELNIRRDMVQIGTCKICGRKTTRKYKLE